MIGVFAGTSDGKAIVNRLLEASLRVVVFNGSQAGAEMFDDHELLICSHEKLDMDGLKEAVVGYGLTTIVDATHPYAQVITRNLLDLKEALSLDYFRYLRPSTSQEGYDSYGAIVDVLKGTQGKILLTTGSNNLHIFTEHLDLNRLICRVLPTPEVIGKCKALGFKTSQIIGMQGPFSLEANALLMAEKSIAYLVTKESGHQGGFREKMDAAKACGVQALVLKRPTDEHSTSYDSYAGIVEAVMAHLKK